MFIYSGGKHYTGYQATQKQRAFEKAIRDRKRRILIDEGLGDAEQLQTDQIKLVSLQEAYKRFSKAADLPMQHARMEKSGFDGIRGMSAENEAKKYYKYWSKSIGANESAKTLADYYEMKYNKHEEYNLLKQYAKDVKKGWISPLSGFDNYKAIHARIQTEIVGHTAINGVVISRQSNHFMQRVIGTMADPEILKMKGQTIRRSGVEVDDLVDVVFNGKARPVKIDPRTGKRSQTIYNSRCQIIINPDDGTLVQCNLL